MSGKGRVNTEPRSPSKSTRTVHYSLLVCIDSAVHILSSFQGRPPFLQQIGPVSTVIRRDKELSIIHNNYKAKRTSDSDSDSAIIQVDQCSIAD